MREATTPYCKDIQERVQIKKEFLESQGWVLKEDYPLFDVFEHKMNSNLYCSIGLYGEFSIVLKHWMNKTSEREFTTCNPNLTKEDYFKVLELLNIKVAV